MNLQKRNKKSNWIHKRSKKQQLTSWLKTLPKEWKRYLTRQYHHILRTISLIHHHNLMQEHSSRLNTYIKITNPQLSCFRAHIIKHNKLNLYLQESTNWSWIRTWIRRKPYKRVPLVAGFCRAPFSSDCGRRWLCVVCAD